MPGSCGRDVDAEGLASREATSLLQHLRCVDPHLSPATMDDLREALEEQLRQLDQRVEELHGVLRRIRICLHRGLRHGNTESAVLYLLLFEPLLRCLACKAKGNARHTMPPPVQAYCDDLLLIAHTLSQFLEYAEVIA